MNEFGFIIRTLRIVGPGKVAAEVSFQAGLNVISGASDTGKSYIAECLDYMLGGQTPPEEIPQAAGYTTVLLEIEPRVGQRFVLTRALRGGGGYLLYETPLAEWQAAAPSRPLKATHSASKTDNISRLLLALSNLDGDKIIEKPTAGKTRMVRFRDVVEFTLVKEDRIIAKRSPILPSVQHPDEYKCRSLFNLFITGRNYNAVQPIVDQTAPRAGWAAKSALLDQLIQVAEQEVAGQPMSESEAQAIIEANPVDSALAVAVRDTTAEIQRLESAKREAWDVQVRHRSRNVTIVQLLDRFELLMKHYQSDLERLTFISEGEYLLAQLGDAHCPLCGHVVDEHTQEQWAQDARIQSDIQTSTRSEAAKIRKHMADLSETLGALRNEQTVREEAIATLGETIRQADHQIRQELQPKLQRSYEEMLRWSEAKQLLALRAMSRQRVAKLSELKSALGEQPEQQAADTAEQMLSADAAPLRQFFDALETLLRQWRFPTVGTVELGEKSDLVVNGQARKGHGKGHRAVMHAAFTIALMRFAKEHTKKHPTVVIVDSPLTCFKQNDRYSVENDVKVGFYEHLKSAPKDEQIIVIENDRPPQSVLPGLFHTHFSGPDGPDRPGFYPVPSDALAT